MNTNPDLTYALCWRKSIRSAMRDGESMYLQTAKMTPAENDSTKRCVGVVYL